MRKPFSKPKVVILSGYGLNCEEETRFAYQQVGGSVTIVHINDLIRDPSPLLTTQILVFPGGFSFGDDTGSGKAYANKIKNHLSLQLSDFLARDTLTIGICNGFQILTNLGLLPGGLVSNSGGAYIDRWVDLEATGKSPWLTGIKKISLPIAHGEGQYRIDPKLYTQMFKAKEIALVYTNGELCTYQNLPANPNGSMHDIAGILGYNGRILGLMPHPERAIFYHHRPDWHLQKERLKRKGKMLSSEGAGLVLFRNSISYFTKS